MDQEDSIPLTIRSFLFPDEAIAGFQLGEPFAMKLPTGTTVQELTDNIYFKKSDQIGVTAVNGRLAPPETVLMPGDAIDFYPLLDGG